MALRAIVSSNNLRAIVDTDSLEPVTVFADIQSVTDFVNLEYGIDFLNLSAVDIVLDADSKDLYFTPLYREDQVQNITITESVANAIAKTVADGAFISELGALSTGQLA